MSSVLEVMSRLDEYAVELDKRSKELAQVERELEPVEQFIEEFTDDFECALWEAHTKRDEKLPSAELRERLARKQMPAEVVTRHGRLLARRKRLEKRIRHLGDVIDAQRSILSALKAEMEAVA